MYNLRIILTKYRILKYNVKIVDNYGINRFFFLIKKMISIIGNIATMEVYRRLDIKVRMYIL